MILDCCHCWVWRVSKAKQLWSPSAWLHVQIEIFLGKLKKEKKRLLSSLVKTNLWWEGNQAGHGYSMQSNTHSWLLSPRIHISVQIPHQDGMLPLISTMPLHNLHFLLSESIYRHQHVCSNLVTTRDLRGISGEGKVWYWFAHTRLVQCLG